MVNAQEAEASDLINKVKEKLKDEEEIEKPEWAKHAKTSSYKERRPDQPDWWYTRAASILRRIYIQGPQGVEPLRSWYGGKKKKGRRPPKHQKASGKIIRTLLQQLENAEYLEKTDEGRKITPQGKSLLDQTTNEIKK